MKKKMITKINIGLRVTAGWVKEIDRLLRLNPVISLDKLIFEKNKIWNEG
jgi:hypothetical protein